MVCTISKVTAVAVTVKREYCKLSRSACLSIALRTPFAIDDVLKDHKKEPISLNTVTQHIVQQANE